MKKITLLFTIFGLLIGNLNAQVITSFNIADQTSATESQSFIDAIGTNGFASTGTIEANALANVFGVDIKKNSSLTYTANVAAGDYIIEGIINVQNTTNHHWIQDAWASGDPVPSAQFYQTGTNGTFMTYSKTVTVATAGDYVFGIVRGTGGNGKFLVKSWSVTKDSGAASTETDITAFTLAAQTGAATIDAGAHTIDIEVAYNTVLTSLTPTITLSAGAAVSPNSGVVQDFTSAVNYTVTAEDGTTTQVWVVTVTEADPVAAGNIFDFALADESETDAFVAAMPGNGFVGVNTLKNSFQTIFGIKILPDGSLTYAATSLAPGDYEMEVDIMVQNTAVLPWVQDAWLTSGSAPATSAPSLGTNVTFVKLTKTVTLTAGDHTFGIVRGGSGSQLFVKGWKVDFIGPTLSVDTDVIENNFSVSRTGVTLINVSGNLQIIDLLGRTLVSKQLRKQETLSYNFNSATIYMIKLTTEKGSATKKVVFN